MRNRKWTQCDERKNVVRNIRVTHCALRKGYNKNMSCTRNAHALEKGLTVRKKKKNEK
jgi:hypothetical protein